MIDNYNRLNIGKYIDILAVSRNESLEDIDRQVQILSILTGISEEEVMHLPIGEYKELVARSQFLNPENIGCKQIARKYLVGGYELIPVTDFRKLETCQYIDFQTYAQDMDKYMVELLSVILVPKGHRYNDGYDIMDLQHAIRDDMSTSDGVSLVAFFLTLCGRSIKDSLNSSRREAMRIKDKTRREEMLQKIREQEMRLGTSGDGSPM